MHCTFAMSEGSIGNRHVMNCIRRFQMDRSVDPLLYVENSLVAFKRLFVLAEIMVRLAEAFQHVRRGGMRRTVMRFAYCRCLLEMVYCRLKLPHLPIRLTDIGSRGSEAGV